MVLRLGRDSFAVALIDHCSPAVPPVQVGPGVKGLSENDWVVPLKPFLGTWRSLAGGQRTLSLACLHALADRAWCATTVR